MSPSKPIVILFDATHNEEVVIHEPELSKLFRLLEMNGMKARLVETQLTSENLAEGQVLVLGNPRDSLLESNEIQALKTFAETGGGLLLVSGATIFGKGGDVARLTNLNSLIKHLNFEFSDRAIGRGLEGDTGDGEELIVAIPAKQHPLVIGVSQLLFTTSTSIKAEDTASHLFRAANIPGNPTIVVAVETGEGRILAMGGTTPFFNDYVGIADHEVFIVQALRWLAGQPMNKAIKSLGIPSKRSTEAPPPEEVIADLQKQLDQIEEELSSLRQVIHSSLKEMEKIIRQLQEEKVKKDSENES